MPTISPDHIALGRAVRELRRSRGHSQEGFADAAGMHRTYVGGIERGERNVSFATILKLADALALPPSVLVQRYEAIRLSGGR
jgi:transcriptional regulator with XRE-family HTH domain